MTKSLTLLIITIINCIMVTNSNYLFYNNNYGAEWGTGVLHSLQNCLRPACQVWWVRFPHSPANSIIPRILENSFLHRPEGTRSFFCLVVQVVPFSYYALKSYSSNPFKCRLQSLLSNQSSVNRYSL